MTEGRHDLLATLLIGETAIRVANEDEDLRRDLAQLRRLIASEPVGVVALRQLAERVAHVGVGRFVADAEHEERVQLAQRLCLGLECVDQLDLGRGDVLAVGDHRRPARRWCGGGSVTTNLRFGGERVLDHPHRLCRKWLEPELDAGAALRIDDVLGDRALQLDHGRTRQLEIDANQRADRRLVRCLEEHRAATQIALVDRG
jgi:hypothetical protein